ncbi:hypothetical protein MMC13_006007 [Lambiella insularis]|nr:hypothetical protein [Lambiella insularis]
MGSQATRTVPIVDLSAFTSGNDLAERQRVAKDLAQKCSVNGCLGIKGHQIPDADLVEAFDSTARLFALPMEDKMKAPHPNAPTAHRGYSAPGRERGYMPKDTESNDEKHQEALKKTPDLKVRDRAKTTVINCSLAERCQESFEIGDDANAAEQNLTDAERHEVRELHDGSRGQFRLLHYLPLSTHELAAAENSRLPAHTDWSSFTISFQDATGGLEFQDRHSGTFMPATPQSGLLYLNVGDMFTRLSNGVFTDIDAIYCSYD